jgi:putative transposase
MSDKFLADKDWEEAECRARVLAELSAQLTQGNVDWAMRELDVSRSTLFGVWCRRGQNSTLS